MTILTDFIYVCIIIIMHGEHLLYQKLYDTAVAAYRKKNYKFKYYGHYVKNIVTNFYNFFVVCGYIVIFNIKFSSCIIARGI